MTVTVTDLRECWKPVEGEFNGIYEVSNLGRVKNRASGKIMSQFLNREGYLCVVFCLNGWAVNKLVHQLVGRAFLDNPTNRIKITHLRDNTDNSVENLTYEKVKKTDKRTKQVQEIEILKRNKDLLRQLDENRRENVHTLTDYPAFDNTEVIKHKKEVTEDEPDYEQINMYEIKYVYEDNPMFTDEYKTIIAESTKIKASEKLLSLNTPTVIRKIISVTRLKDALCEKPAKKEENCGYKVGDKVEFVDWNGNLAIGIIASFAAGRKVCIRKPNKVYTWRLLNEITTI